MKPQTQTPERRAVSRRVQSWITKEARKAGKNPRNREVRRVMFDKLISYLWNG